MIIRVKHKPTILALDLITWKELHKMVTSHTDPKTKRLSCINLHDHTHQAKPNQFGVGVVNMERATQDGYITHRSIHEKNIMHQPSWTYASSKPNHLGVGVTNMERATQDGYITHRSIHEKNIMHQPSLSYASSVNQPSWRWSYKHVKSYTRWLHRTPINTRKDFHASTFMIIRIKQTQPSWRWSYQHGKSYARWLHHTPINTRKEYHASTSMIIRIKHNQPSWRWSYQHGKSYTTWLHHTPINTRKDYHVSTFMIIRIKHNPTILALELSTWKELRTMFTSHTDQCTKRLSCINLHDHTHQA